MKTSLSANILRAALLTATFAFNGCVVHQLSAENRATGQPQETFGGEEKM